jgi:DNA-binding NarL/FixJ family response regulator
MKILLVDDHILFREGIALLLKPLMADDKLLQAGTCAEALKVLADNAGVELVLMDIQLPDASGLSAIPLIKERFPDMPVVALSSRNDRETILSAIDAGAMGFIPKSSSPAVLFAALQLVLADGIYLPPELLLRERSVPAPSPGGGDPPKPGQYTTPGLGLTQRQAEVLFFLLHGKSTKEIGRELQLAEGTVKVHTSAVLRALNVTTRTQAVIAAARIELRFHLRPGRS